MVRISSSSITINNIYVRMTRRDESCERVDVFKGMWVGQERERQLLGGQMPLATPKTPSKKLLLWML